MARFGVHMIFDARRPVLITGGAGFIGANLAHRLLSDGQPVLVFDNLSRAGVADNLTWLRERHGSHIEVQVADVRDALLLRRAVRRACRVFHLAAQVAVNTSLTDPIQDFEVNAHGTLNLLEAIRTVPEPPPLLYTSTSKIYGALAAVELDGSEGRYLPKDVVLRSAGIGEDHPLDFHSPHGCSKGAADQYVLDYARMYQLPAVVFRLSSVYGPNERGTEEQGWVAHFLARTLRGEPITIHGDGRQVRDALHVDDLVEAMCRAQVRLARVAGRPYNVGGGVRNALSLRQLLEIIRRVHGSLPEVRFGPWRIADQRYYVADIGAFAEIAGWRPRIGVEEGVRQLHGLLRDSIEGRKGPVRAFQTASMAVARS
jgi:CDP-paratose 2-epimerase